MQKVNKVIVIDDDQVTCYLNKIFFEEMQVTEDVQCFDDAEKALAFLEQLCIEGSWEESGPDLIFLDINMPRMNGFEFLEKVRQLEGQGGICSQRIVMYTSSVHPKDIERANSYNILAYLNKPLTEPKMKSVLEAFHNRNN